MLPPLTLVCSAPRKDGPVLPLLPMFTLKLLAPTRTLPMVSVALVVLPPLTPAPLSTCAASPPATIWPAPVTPALRLKKLPLAAPTLV